MLEYVKCLDKWILALAVAAFMAIMLHPLASAQTGRAGLVAEGEPPDLILLYTGDVIGYIDPCG